MILLGCAPSQQMGLRPFYTFDLFSIFGLGKLLFLFQLQLSCNLLVDIDFTFELKALVLATKNFIKKR